jgi:hypothetical protein
MDELDPDEGGAASSDSELELDGEEAVELVPVATGEPEAEAEAPCRGSTDPESEDDSDVESEDFNAKTVAADWLHAFTKGTLGKDGFRNHLKLIVPKAYTYLTSPDYHIVNCDMVGIKQTLLEPFQRFIFNKPDGDPEEFNDVSKVDTTGPT